MKPIEPLCEPLADKARIVAPLSAPPDWEAPPSNSYARDAVSFFQALPHVKGELANRGLTLGDSWLDWEERLTRIVWGRRENGRRVVRTVYSEQPKKTGKSHYAAGVGLEGLWLEEEQGAEVYSVAYNQDQAKVVWQLGADMIARDRVLGLADDLEVKEYRNRINAPDVMGIWEPVSREVRSKHGWNPSRAIYDEFHSAPTRDMYDVIKDSMGARQQPLLFIITNSGVDRSSICYELRQYALAVNEGRVDDPSFVGLIFGAPDDADWTDRQTWLDAHPGIPVTVPVERVRQACETAKVQPTAQNAFKRWHLSQWTQQVTRWIDSARWDAARERIDWTDYEGSRCYGGLDIGSVSDLTAWVLAFPDEDDHELVRLKCIAWCPEDQLWDRKNIYREQYQAWHRDGWLNVTPGQVIDHGPVKQQIVADAERFGLVDMWVDTQFNAHQLLVELGRDHDIEVAAGRTTYTQLTAPCDEFERRLLLDPPKVRHDGNPVFAWAVQNVALQQARYGDGRRPVKDVEAAKIDPVIAAIGALDRCMRHEEAPRPSKYEEEELLVL